jgi:Cu(I)/Ag(I) efflux system membrane fusion protein
VPTEAVIQTGKRTVVMLAEDNGHFRPVEVRTGVESGGQTEIKRGLQAASAWCVVAVPDRFGGQPAGPGGAAERRACAQAARAPRFDGEGKVEASAATLTICARPIPR